MNVSSFAEEKAPQSGQGEKIVEESPKNESSKQAVIEEPEENKTETQIIDPEKLFTGRAFWGNVIGIDDPEEEEQQPTQSSDVIPVSSLLSLKAHSGPVESIAFTQDHLNLISGGSDRQIILWDAISGEEKRRFSGNRAPIAKISVGKEGQFFASCSTSDRRVLLWDIKSDASVLEYPQPPFEPCSIALGTDASVLIVGQRDGRISVYHKSGESPDPRINTFKGHLLAVNNVVLSPDEKRFLSCGNDQTVAIWDTQTQNNVLSFKEHRGAVLCADISSGGKTVASAGADRTIILWDSETGREIKRLQGHQGDVTTVIFNADASQIVSASKDRTVILWDVDSGKPLKISQKRNSPILCASLNEQSGTVAVSCANGMVEILPAFTRIPDETDTENSATQNDAKTHGEKENGQSPARIVVTVMGDDPRFDHSRRISKFMDLPQGKRLHRIGRSNDYSDFGSISPNGFYFASINTRRGDGMLWNTDSGKEIRILQTSHRLSAIRFHSKDSRFLFTGSRNGSIQYWNLRQEKIVADLPGHLAPVQAIDVSSDGKQLLTGAMDGSVILWDILEKKKIRTISCGQEIQSLKFSPNAQHFVGGGADHIVRVWDVESFTEKQLLGHTAGKISVAFLPNNRQVVSGAADGKIIFWNITSKKPVKEIVTQTEMIKSLAITPNGRFLITGGNIEEFSLIWSLEQLAADERPIMLLPFQGGPVTDVVFHPKHLAVITVGGRTPIYWSISSIIE